MPKSVWTCHQRAAATRCGVLPFAQPAPAVFVCSQASCKGGAKAPSTPSTKTFDQECIREFYSGCARSDLPAPGPVASGSPCKGTYAGDATCTTKDFEALFAGKHTCIWRQRHSMHSQSWQTCPTLVFDTKVPLLGKQCCPVTGSGHS